MVKCVNLGDVLEYFALKTLVIFVDLEAILKFEFGQWVFSVRSIWMWNFLFIWGFTSLSTLYRSYHDG